ncbi:hypothetical protein NN561_017925 [Cricetulus griseus]
MKGPVSAQTPQDPVLSTKEIYYPRGPTGRVLLRPLQLDLVSIPTDHTRRRRRWFGNSRALAPSRRKPLFSAIRLAKLMTEGPARVTVHMATDRKQKLKLPGSMAPGTRIKDLESQATSVQQAHQPLLASRPIMLLTLPAPAKDYLCLSITSFCFCILLAIPALVFSFKTREANYDGDWRRAQRNSRLALAFSVSSILVGCILMASSITLILETEEVTSS